MNKPEPGTDEALRQGCLCPKTSQQIANHKQHPVQKIVRDICPIHGWKDNSYPGS